MGGAYAASLLLGVLLVCHCRNIVLPIGGHHVVEGSCLDGDGHRRKATHGCGSILDLMDLCASDAEDVASPEGRG
jgi:hypothetical protein